MLIDSHAHLDADSFKEDLDALVDRAKNAGVESIISIGAGSGGFTSAHNARALHQKYPSFVHYTVGIHPCDASFPHDPQTLHALAQAPEVIALGETGLDLFWKETPLNDQIQWLESHVSIARTLQKPLVIHSRQATKECLEVLKRTHAAEVGGVFHCYTDSSAFVEDILDLNFHLSFTGIATFKKSAEVHTSIIKTPVDKILVETDAPFLAPEPFRGKRCESAHVVHTARKIAELKGLPYEDFCCLCTQTTKRLFRLP